jgi:hypothetical protein
VEDDKVIREGYRFLIGENRIPGDQHLFHSRTGDQETAEDNPDLVMLMSVCRGFRYRSHSKV